jgi:hypothetical protein
MASIITVMEDSVLWTVKVSPEVDEAVRAYLAGRRRRPGDLSRLIEEALRAQIFEKSVERVKRRTARVGYAQLKAIVREAVQYARKAR